jgi:hypothetical protein
LPSRCCLFWLHYSGLFSSHAIKCCMLRKGSYL